MQSTQVQTNSDDFNAAMLYGKFKEQPYTLSNFLINVYDKKRPVNIPINTRVFSLLLRGLIIDFGGGILGNPFERELLVNMLKYPGITNFLYEDEIKPFNDLPELINIYRGGKIEYTDSIFWTLSKDFAKAFGEFKSLDYILQGQIYKKDILLFVIGEGNTIVCNWPDVQNISKQSI